MFFLRKKKESTHCLFKKTVDQFFDSCFDCETLSWLDNKVMAQISLVFSLFEVFLHVEGPKTKKVQEPTMGMSGIA